jgi:lipopolysaccharide transport system permease protein
MDGEGVLVRPSEVAGGVGPGALPDPSGSLRVVEPPAPGLRRYVAEVWRQRAAFGYFGRRYVQKRISRTFLGYVWLFLPVLLPLFMGALVFGGILDVRTPGIPYFLYFIVALSAWTVFAMTAYWATRSLEISRSEIRRVYVPRVIPLIASATMPLLTLGIFLMILACAVVYYVLARGEFYLDLGPLTLLAPVAVAMLVAFALACGLWFSPVAPRARDVRRLAGTVLGIWYFLTPVIYPVDEIPEGWRFLASLNPVTAPVEIFKQAWIGDGHVTSLGLAVYCGALIVATVVGLRIFLPRERRDSVFY